MSIVIRAVDLETELETLREVFNANFRIQGTLERFRWLYFENPDGQATAWFALDDRNGAIAGCTAVLPRRIRMQPSDRVVVAWNCGDFCISPAYRTVGVALKLRRAAKDAVDRATIPFLYAHPNDRMLQIHLRAGHTALGSMVRHARVLRPLGWPAAASALAALALRFAGREVLLPRRHDVEVVSGPVPEDVGDIYERVARRIGTSLVRDARYLDWRFRRCPVEAHTLLVIRKAERPVGYIVYSVRDDVAVVKDWLAVDATSRDGVFAALLRRLRAERVGRASATILESHPDVKALRSFGFLRRPDVTTAITYASPADGILSQVASADRWYMTAGDRDL